jgi:hypothetical protein
MELRIILCFEIRNLNVAYVERIILIRDRIFGFVTTVDRAQYLLQTTFRAVNTYSALKTLFSESILWILLPQL